MKKQLFLYLFIIAALMNVFTYMYFTRKQQSEKAGNTAQNDGTVTAVTTHDSIKMMQEQLLEANYFALENNDNAQEYFYNNGNNYQELMPKIKDALLEYNADKKGNKYVDQVGYDNKMYLINKIKILNHRWIIADYSNGEMWGEVLLKYFINDDKTISFETIETILYPKPTVSQ